MIKKILMFIPSVLLAAAIIVLSVLPEPQKMSGLHADKAGSTSKGILADAYFSDIDYDEFAPVTDRKEQTIMIYMIGSNLESQNGLATLDLQEMLESKADINKCNVVVFTGGSYYWYAGFPRDKNVMLYMAGTGNDRNFYAAYETELLDMASPDTLAFFVNVAYRSFPADNYSLILWDHGSGTFGYGADEISGNMMDVQGISNALSLTPINNVNRLKWIAFDACLMANYETAYCLRDYSEYLIGSEEVSSGAGFYYEAFSDICNNVYSGSKVAEIIADYSYDYLDEVDLDSYMSGYTLSCVDLNKIANVENALSGLYAEAEKNVASCFKEYSAFRSNMFCYGDGMDSDIVDLYSLAEFWAQKYPEQTSSLLDSIRDAVAYNKSNDSYSNGLSIYSPYDLEEAYLNYASSLYERAGLCQSYMSFNKKFYNIFENGGSVTSGGDYAAEEPTTQPTTEKPTAAVTTTTEPTVPSTTEKPTTQTTTEKPTTQTTTEKPTAQPTTEKPTAAVTTATEPASQTTSQQSTASSDGWEYIAPGSQPGSQSPADEKNAAEHTSATTSGGANSIVLTLSPEKLGEIAKIQKRVYSIGEGGKYSLLLTSDNVSVLSDSITAEFENDVYYISCGDVEIPCRMYEVQRTKTRKIYESQITVCRTSEFSYEAAVKACLRIVFDTKHPDGYVEGMRFVGLENYTAHMQIKPGYSFAAQTLSFSGMQRDEAGNLRCPEAWDNIFVDVNEKILHVDEDGVKLIKKSVKDVGTEEAGVKFAGCIYIKDVYGNEYLSDFVELQ